MASQNSQAPLINAEGQNAVDQPQLNRDAATSQQSNAQNANFLDKTGESVKTMTHGAADIASGAASGVLGLAQGAATGAANVAQGAAGAVQNTFGNNPGSQK